MNNNIRLATIYHKFGLARKFIYDMFMSCCKKKKILWNIIMYIDLKVIYLVMIYYNTSSQIKARVSCYFYIRKNCPIAFKFNCISDDIIDSIT